MQRRAFTLVELVMVLTIMAITAAIAVPRYQHATARYRALATARRLAADIDALRQAAIAGSLAHLLRASAGASIYEIADRTSGWGSGSSISIAGEPYRASFSAVDLGADGELVFDGYGVPDAAASFTLVSGNAAAQVTVENKTGRTSVKLIRKS